jgi:hypothetical protein
MGEVPILGTLRRFPSSLTKTLEDVLCQPEMAE